MPRLSLAFIATLLVFAAGCGDQRPEAAAVNGAKPVPGNHVEGGGFAPFYAEILHEKRIYLFGTKATHDAFMAAKELNPLKARMLIAKGPGRETVVVETDKDSPQMTKRLLNQFKSRYGLTWTV